MPGPDQSIDQERQRRERAIAEDTIARALQRFERESGLRAMNIEIIRHSPTIGGTERPVMCSWITAELPRD